MFKSKPANPSGVNSVSDSNDVEKLALTSHKSTWAPLVFFLGPCFSVKKVQFGRPVEHISYRDTSKLYESISTDTAVLVWSNAAHEGTLKGLRQTVVYGVSMYDRLQSELCLEMRLCALYFNQRITKKELLGEMRHLITDDFVFESFQMALRRMRNEKIAFKLTNTLQLFIPEVQADARVESITRLKWAVKYNPEVICFDEGNLSVDVYDVQDGFMFAHKYGRKIRIARWGGEIPNVPLCELLYRSLLDFLQTGRYVDCEYVARARTYAESKSLNGLGQLATSEDVAFDYGYVLDKDGFITKLHKPLTPLLGKKFFVADLFRTKKASSPTAVRTEKDTKSPRRVSSFRSAFTSKSSAESAPDDTQIIERQIQRELGMNIHDSMPPPAAAAGGSVVSVDIGTVIEKESEGEGSLALIVAEAARNAQKVRRETNWVVFLNHKVPSHVTATYIRSKKGTAQAKESPAPPALANKARIESVANADELTGLGSYTYGLGEKKPYKPAQSSAADTAALTGPKDVWAETAEILAPTPVVKQETKTVRAAPPRVEVVVRPDLAPHKQVELNLAPPQMQQPSLPGTVPAVSPKKSEKKTLIIVVPDIPNAGDETTVHTHHPNHSTQSLNETQHVTDTVNEKLVMQQAAAQKDRAASLEGVKEVTVKDTRNMETTDSAPATMISTQQDSTKHIHAESAAAVIVGVSKPMPVPPPIVVVTAPAPLLPAAISRVASSPQQSVAPKPKPDPINTDPPVSVPVSVPLPRFSPRARLVPTLSDSDVTSANVSANISEVADKSTTQAAFAQKEAAVVRTESTVDTTNEAADQAVATALKNASVFKARDAAPAAVPVQETATPTVTTVQQPRISAMHRPVLRAPSAMKVQSTGPLSRLSTAPVPTEESATPTFVPVTVKEKKDVIETRIRSHKAPIGVQAAVSPRNLTRGGQSQSVAAVEMPVLQAVDTTTSNDDYTDIGVSVGNNMTSAVSECTNSVTPSAVMEAEPTHNEVTKAKKEVPSPHASQAVQDMTAKPVTQKSLQKKWSYQSVMRAPVEVPPAVSPKKEKQANSKEQEIHSQDVPVVMSTVEIPMQCSEHVETNSAGNTATAAVSVSTKSVTPSPVVAVDSVHSSEREPTNRTNKVPTPGVSQAVQDVAAKPLTQKSLQKKWAFSTVMQHQLQ